MRQGKGVMDILHSKRELGIGATNVSATLGREMQMKNWRQNSISWKC